MVVLSVSNMGYSEIDFAGQHRQIGFHFVCRVDDADADAVVQRLQRTAEILHVDHLPDLKGAIGIHGPLRSIGDRRRDARGIDIPPRAAAVPPRPGSACRRPAP